MVKYNYDFTENILRDIFADSIVELAQVDDTRQGDADELRETRMLSRIGLCFLNSDTTTAIDLRPSSGIVWPLGGPRPLSDHVPVFLRLPSLDGRPGNPRSPIAC